MDTILVGRVWAVPALLAGLVAVSAGAQTPVVVSPEGGLAEASEVQLVTLEADGVVRGVAHYAIDLDPDVVVTCAGDDVWCPHVRLDDPAAERIIVPAYPRASMSVVLELPPGEHWASEPIQIDGWLYDDSAEAPLLFTESASVEVASGRVEALWGGPEGVLDLRLTVPNWIPHYWFDVEPEGGVVELGEARLRRGASASAFVVDVETALPLVGATASLEPPQDFLEDQRAERLRVSGSTNERGFVQLEGVEPGAYDLIVEVEARPSVRLAGVEMQEGKETWLGDVPVHRYRTITIRTDPPSDDGAPWRIQLERMVPPWDTTEETTDEFGVLVRRELVPGPYVMKVFDLQGNQLVSEERTIERDDDVSVSIRLSRVRGRVLLGEDGHQAMVELSTGAGAWTMFETDSEGRFGGRVSAPTEDEFIAFVDTETISREFEVEPVWRDGHYNVTFQLGAFGVSGFVLDRQDGFPLEGVDVELVRPTGAESGPRRTTTDLDGQFVFEGLDDETHVVSAYLEGYSRSQQVEVRPSRMDEDDDIDPAVTLYLREGTELEVLVTSETGTPQRSAHLWVLTLTPDGVGVGSSLTNLSGHARLVVPRSVTPAAVVVRAPTGVLWSGCVPVPPEGTTMEIRMPSGPGGTLRVTPSGAPNSIATPEHALVSIDGGLLTTEALGMWMSDQQVPFAHDGTLTVPRVASNHYSVADISGLGLAAYPAACQGAVRPIEPWELLVAGGELQLRMRFSVDDEVPFWNLP